MEIIKTQHLTFTYPDSDSAALRDISLSVNKGEFVTVCGRSGCGKSTFLRQLKPALAPFGTLSGEVLFCGKDIKNLTHREQSEKIGYVMQNPETQIVTDKVWHELAFGLENLGYTNSDIRARVSEMASFFGIEDWFHKSTSELSGGQKQLLNLASVMVMQPDILLLDEPTGQLDPIAAREFLETLYKINREIGTTVIITEHRLEEAFPLSDRVVVMDNGAVIADGAPREVGMVLKNAGHPMIAALPTPMKVHFAVPNDEECPITVREGKMWLERLDEKININKNLPEDIPYENPDNAVTLKDVWFRYDRQLPDVIKGLSLTVKRGEFYAILGGNGVGKSTTLSVVGSHLKPYRGKVEVDGKVAMLPQNPQVLFTEKTVKSDITQMGEDISYVVSLCELENLLERHPYDLSGGEQQRVALAKVLMTKPDILLFDEPTKGFDAYFKEKFAQIIAELKADGTTVIMVSHDIEFCAEYADRCAMFFDGNIVSCAAPREFFGGKNFYTTAANRMARSVIPAAVLAEDIISACGVEIKREKNTLPKEKREIKEEKTDKKIKRNYISGIVFFALFLTVQIGFVDKYIGWVNIILQILSLVLAGICLSNFIPQRILCDRATDVTNVKRKFSVRTLVSALMVLIAIPITIYIGIYRLGDRKYMFISLMIILETLLPFVILFEKRRPHARELVVLSVLCAIAVLSREAFFMLPQFKPVLALVIIIGVCFGGEAGFLSGAVIAFVSNFFSSQGPWTPWQMFAMGIVGFIAGIIFNKGIIAKTRINLCVFGAVAAIAIYGGIMNPASVLMWNTHPTADLIISSFVLGFSFDVIHAVSTVFFLWILSVPLLDKLERIIIKYGL
ncbi:MAG: ATP-binding cassette domain-containing protein [Clostridia bacterium]|nr:ATP-binding cassette domain-containing protein [Clostridia bacterium]